MKNFSNLKRITALIMTLLMILSSFANVIAATPSDFVDFPTGWSKEAVTAAVNNGLLNGRTANTIVPEGNLTRAEMATIINRAFGATVEKNISAFWDVPADAWYYHEVAKAYNMQTFQGDAAGTMRPEDFITREEVFAVIARALVLETSDYSSLGRFYDAGYISDWAKPYAAILVSKGYVNGDTSGNINPLSNITREEFAQIMHNIVKTYYTVAGDYNYTGPSSSLIRSGNVTLSNVTIEGDLILGDGVGKGNVTLNNVTIKGRLLARGGEGKVTLTNTTVAGGVVVKDVNGIVNFNNYRKEAPFAGIREITKATFLGEGGGSVGGSTGGGGGGGGGGTPPAPVVPTPTKITITYNAMGGTVLPASTSIIPNGTISSLPTPTRTGYDFDGWYKNSSYTGDRVTTSTTFSSSTTIYAKWNIKKYNVTIDAPNGNDKNIEYEHGQTIGDKLNFNELLPSGKTLEDYKFYYMDGTTEVVVSSASTVVKPLAITYKEAKVVTFEYGYDNKIDTRKVFPGESLGSKYITATRTGYRFDGWFTSGGAEVKADTVINDVLTLTAKWTANTYNITYVSKTPQGTTIDFTTSFKNEPSHFKFKTDTDFTLPVDDGGVFVPHSDYEFDGWSLKSDGSERVTKLSKDTHFDDVTLYAIWILKSDIDAGKYVTVTVNLAPHAETYTFRQLKNTVLSSGELLNNNISKGKDKGYRLKGFTGYDFTQPLTSDVTINADWEAIIYTIVYHIENNGLIASDASFVGVSGRQDFTAETTGNVPLYTKANVSCTGIEFVSWHKDSKDGPAISVIDPDDYIGGSEEIHVYAKWDWQKFTVNAYATTDPGAENYSFNNVVYNTTVGQLNIPTFTRRGYKYTKFSTTGTDAGDIYELTDSIKSNLTIYPLWEKEIYSITLVADAKNANSSNGRVVFSDGTPDEQTRDFTIDVETGLPLELSSAVSFRNTGAYEFKGWYEAYDDTTKTFSGEIADGKINSISWHNRTAYARWDVKTYTVKFVLSDGTISKTYEYGEELKYIPTREGYSFESWTSSLGDTLWTGARIYKNYTLTPNWSANTYYVNLNADPSGNTGIEFTVSSDARMPFTLDECPKALPDVSKFTGNDIYDFDGWYTAYNSVTGEYTGKVNSVNGLSDKERTYYAKWTKKKYDVTFTGYETVTREHGTVINYPVTKDGYSFVEWEDMLGNKYSNTDIVTGPLTLTPVWKLNTYTVNLVADPEGFGDIDFINSSDASFEFNIEELSPKKPLPVAFNFNPDKYAFDGWYATSDGAGQKITDISSIHDAGKTFYAKWSRKTYTVTFDGYGTKTYYYDDMLGSDGIAGIPYEIKGYNRVEWNTANDGTGTTYTSNSKIKGDITLFLYRAVPKTYTITYVGKGTAFKFDDNIPGYIPPENYTVENDILLPLHEVIVLSDGSEDFSRMFAGWYTDPGLTQKIINIPQGTTGNLTLHPKFIDVADWFVDFVDAEDPTIIYDVQTVYDGQLVQKPQPDPTKEGKKFIGWHYVDRTSSTLKPFDFNTPITDDIVLMATWDDIVFNVYYKYPDKEVSSSGILYGDSLLQIIHENRGIPEKDGYFFKGWTLTEGSSTIDYYDDDVVTEEINGILYPVWEPELYTIELYDNPTYIPGISPKDYSAIDTDFYITDLTGDGFKLPVAEDYNAPDEYEFKGWFENSLDGNRVTHITSISQANNKYYAKWVRKSFEVKYVYSDGQVPSDANIEYGDTLAILGTPVRKGYIHAGWENEYGDTYSISHSVKEAIRGTLSPIWQAKTYNIVLDADSQGLGASEKHPELITTEFTTDVIPVTLPLEDKYNAPEGYRLDGWYTEAAFVNKVTQIADVDQAESYTTYYAKWVKKSIIVKYVYDDNAAPSDASIEYGDTLAKLGTPSKEGCNFLGWSKTKGSSTVDYEVSHKVKAEFEDATFVLYPVWERKVYTLEYTHKPDSIKVDEIKPSLIKKEFTIDDVVDGGFALPPEEAYEATVGYTLEGWYPVGLEAIDANRVERITSIGQAGKYWANWVLKTYSVLVYSDGSTTKVTFTHGDTIGSKIDAPIASDGYEFKGWAVEGDATEAQYKQTDKVIEEFASGTVLYPVFVPKTLKLTYVYDALEHIWLGDENPVEFNVTKDVTLYDASVFKQDADWRFDGWYYNGNKIESFTKGTFTSDVTVEAKWTRIYHVTYNYNYTGSVADTRDVFANSAAEYISAPDRSALGWKFIEWQLNGVKYDFASPVTADITLTAKWERIKYNVTFVVDGVETLNTTYEHDDKLSSNSAYSEPTKKGYKFDKWVDSDGKSVTSSGEVTSHLRLTAVWSSPIEYTITYDTDGVPFKSGISSTVKFTVESDAITLYKDDAFADLTNHTFLGWKINGTGDIVTEIEKGKYAENITLVAQWKSAYYVSFDANGGTADDPDKLKAQKITEGEKATEPNVTLTKEGYTFKYWEYKGQKYTFADPVNASITLTAKWEPITYTVVLYNTAGDIKTISDVKYDTDINLADYKDVFTKRGYTLEKWIASDGTSEEFGIDDTIRNLTNKDGDTVTLKASWKVDSYTISFNANNGTGNLNPMSFDYENVPEFLTKNNGAISRKGYTFLGWSTNKADTIEAYSDGSATEVVLSYMIDTKKVKEITLYAIWRENTYYIEFNANGGTGSMEKQTFKYTELKNLTVIDRNNFTKKGYSLNDTEWNVKSDGTGVGYEDGHQVSRLISEDGATLTLYAQWKPISYTVRYHHGVSQSQASNVSGATSDSIHTFDDEKALTENGFERKGYTFKGWTTTPPDGIYSLMNVFSLRTQADDEQIASDSDDIASSDGETKVDYTNGEGVKNLAHEDGDVVILYAVWEANKYKVKYFDDGKYIGGWPSNAYLATYDEQFTLYNLNTVFSEGYDFVEWNTKSDGTGDSYKAGEAVMNLTSEPDATVILYPISKEREYYIQLKYRDDTNDIVNVGKYKYSYWYEFPGAAGHTRTGYTFAGWVNFPDNLSNPTYREGDKREPFHIGNNSTTTYYGAWTPNKYKVSFNVDGGKPLTDAQIPSDASYGFENGQWVLTVTYDDVYPALPTPEWPDGKKYFAYWTLPDGTKLVAGQTVKITDVTVLTAVWTDEIVHTVIFKDYELSGADYVTDVINAHAIEKPQDPPAREGYTFGGWFEDIHFKNPFDFTSQTAEDSPVTYTAYPNWIAHKYEIIFNGNGATSGSMNNQTFKYDREQKLKANSYVKPGYIFDGWTVNSDGTGTYYEDEATVLNLASADGAKITLYAKWKESPYTVNFNGNGAQGAMNGLTFNYTDSVSLPANTYTKDGYTFLGWSENKNDTIPSYKDKASKEEFIKALLQSSDGTITLYAVWGENSYTIAFDGNGAQEGSMSSITLGYSVSQVLPENGFTKTGHSFKYWNTKDDASGITYVDKATVKSITATDGATVTLYAIWEPIPYTVTFDLNGGELPDGVVIGAQTVKYGEYAVEPTQVPVMEGYKFLGWSEDGMGEFDFENTPITENITLKALWQGIPYTITYDLKGSEWKDGYNPQTKYFAKDTVWLPTVNDIKQIPEGYNDIRWVIEGTSTEIVLIAPGQINADVTLVIKWVKGHVVSGAKEITFVDGTKEIPASYKTGDLPLSSQLPIREDRDGYTFEGFNTLADGTGVMYQDYSTASEVLVGTLYYIWKPIEYTISYKNGDNDEDIWFFDENTVKFTYTIEDEVILPPRNNINYGGINKIFLDWYDSDDNPVTKIEKGSMGDKVFTAKFMDNSQGTTYITVTLMMDATTMYIPLSVLKDNSVEDTRGYISPTKDGYTFIGWSENPDATPEDKLYDISTPVTEAITLYAVWKEIPVEKFTVTFYEGAYADEYTYVYEKEVNSGATISNDEITSILEENTWLYENPQEGYIDPETGVHTIPAELWYIAEDGTWTIFDETVQIKSNMNVYYANKKMSFFFNNITIGDFSLTDQILFDVPYRADTRLMDTIKDAIARARVQVNDALANVDIYAQAIEKASEKSKDLLGADGKIKLLEIDTPISSIIKAKEIEGEIKEYITYIIVSANDYDKLYSAISMVADDELITNITGASYDFDTVKAHIDALTPDERADFANEVFNVLAGKDYYKEFIDAFKADHDTFGVSHKNINFVMAVATAVSEYTYEELEARIYARFGKVIDVLGRDVAREFMIDAQKNYYDGAVELWEEMQNNSDNSSYHTTYPSYLTFRVNAIDHVFIPMYNKYSEKVINKLTQDNFYRYNENTYMQELVGKTAEEWVSELFYSDFEDSELDDNDTGYALWPSQGGKSGFMHYYDLFLEKLIIFDKAMLFYKDDEATLNKFYTQMATALNKANEMLAAYEKDGSLPMGKNISDLMEIEAFAKVFNKVEDKLVKVLNKFKATEFYGKHWTAQSVREDIPYAKLIEGVILGTDDPRFNLDSLMEHNLIKKALNKAGFTDYDRSQTDDETGSVTIQAIERNIKGIEIKLARYYQ